MHKNIETVAGCLTRLTCEVITADGATPPELTAYVLIEQQSYPARQEPDGVLLFPAVDYGQHLYEVRADGKPVLFGHLLVRPSAFPQDSGVVDYALAIDASQVDGAKITLTLSPGPRGPKGDTGASAYELAVQNGYTASFDDWMANLLNASFNADQAAASAASATTAAEQAQQAQRVAESSATAAADAKQAAESSATAAADAKQAAESSATAAADARQAAESSATAAADAKQAAESSAATAADDAKQATEASTAAANSAAAAESTLAATAKKAENNTYTGINTFNGAIVANGGVNGLMGPAGWGSAVSLLGARFGAFVGECLQRRIATSFSVKSGNGTLASNRLTVADGEQALAYSPLVWKIIPVNYSTLGALWVPLRKGSTVITGKCRVCVNLCCSLRNYTVQEETMERPIFSYTAASVYTHAHYNVIEFSIEYGPQGQQVVTLLSPIVNANNEMTGMREQSAVVSANNLENNYIGLMGFLIVRTATNAYEVFAVSEDTSCKIYKCGSVWAKNTLYTAEGTTQKLYIGVTEGSWYLPAELIMEASLPYGAYANIAAQVAQATGSPTVTDYSFADFNAKYGIE